MSDIQDQDNQFEEFEESPGGRATPPAGGGGGGRNRAFYIAIGLIGTIFVIALIILLVTLLNKGPQQAAQTKAEADKINAQNTAVAGTATADALRIIHLQQTLSAATPTPLASATFTQPPAMTATSVLAIPTATGTPTATVSADNATKTAVAKTNVALGTKPVGSSGYPGPQTPVPLTPGATVGPGTPQPTATGLPTTGLADEVGLPGLFGLAALLLVVIFLARRARLAH